MEMFRPFSAYRIVATVLIGILVAGSGFPAPAWPQEKGHGVIRGVLYAADENTPLADARVIAVNVRTGAQYPSNPTTQNGTYEVTDLPGGTYDLVVEVAGGIFIADNLVDLASNEALSLSYTVQPQRPANRAVTGLKQPQGSVVVVGSTIAKPNFWTSPKGLTLLGVVAAGVGYVIANNNNDKNGSSSTP